MQNILTNMGKHFINFNWYEPVLLIVHNEWVMECSEHIMQFKINTIMSCVDYN